jgi:hypothetical protein
MIRFRHTIALTLTAVAVSATGALASTAGAPATMSHAASAMAGMPHDASAMAGMPHDASAMAGMHAGMADHHGDHASMASDPEMVAHMARFGIAPDEMAGWMAEGLDPAELHERLVARGVDVDEMLATCPHGDTMGEVMRSMHGGADAPMHGGGVGISGTLHDAHHGG